VRGGFRCDRLPCRGDSTSRDNDYSWTEAEVQARSSGEIRPRSHPRARVLWEHRLDRLWVAAADPTLGRASSRGLDSFNLLLGPEQSTGGTSLRIVLRKRPEDDDADETIDRAMDKILGIPRFNPEIRYVHARTGRA
jgi:hypothetical protein